MFVQPQRGGSIPAQGKAQRRPGLGAPARGMIRPFRACDIHRADMTETKQMIQVINTFPKALGEPELTVPERGESATELELLRTVKEEYVARLRRQKPSLRGLPGKLSLIHFSRHSSSGNGNLN